MSRRITIQEAERAEEQRGEHLHDPGRQRRRKDQLRRDRRREFLKKILLVEWARTLIDPSVWEDFIMWWDRKPRWWQKKKFGTGVEGESYA